MVKQFFLMFKTIGPMQSLRDVRIGAVLALQSNTLCVFGHFAGQTQDTISKCCREHQGLFTLTSQIADGFEVFREAQIQHAVSFIQNQSFDLIKADLTTIYQIKQATWCGHNHLCAFELCNLLTKRHAAHDASNPHATNMANQVDCILADLLGQLTGWAQHQNGW